MAATTVTSAQVACGPVLGDVRGLNVKHAKFTWSRDASASLSVSVCLQLVPMPHGARVLDVTMQVTGQAGQVGSYVIGESLTNRFITTTSLTASTIVTRGSPVDYRISCSESDYATFDTIDMTFGANVTSTRTLCVDMFVWYVMDRQNTGEV